MGAYLPPAEASQLGTKRLTLACIQLPQCYPRTLSFWLGAGGRRRWQEPIGSWGWAMHNLLPNKKRNAQPKGKKKNLCPRKLPHPTPFKENNGSSLFVWWELTDTSSRSLPLHHLPHLCVTSLQVFTPENWKRMWWEGPSHHLPRMCVHLYLSTQWRLGSLWVFIPENRKRSLTRMPCACI